jgi:hypothetical protein
MFSNISNVNIFDIYEIWKLWIIPRKFLGNSVIYNAGAQYSLADYLYNFSISWSEISH